jgi:stress response protein YsnF
MDHRTLTATYATRAEADAAVRRLELIGIPAACITVAGDEPVHRERGFWENLFYPEEDRDEYVRTVSSGGCVVTVTGVESDLHDRAAVILDDDDITADTKETIIPIIEERLNVGKRETVTGRTRVRSYVTERPVEEGVTLREQHVVVEQRTVDRPATSADIAAARDQTIDATSTSEEAVISKTAHVVGEVAVKVGETARTEAVTGTVKKTEVDVDDDTKPRRPDLE